MTDQEERLLLPEEVNKYVLDTVDELAEVIKARMSKIDRRQRFLVNGRVLNYMFQNFYGVVLTFAEKRLQDSKDHLQGDVGNDKPN